MHSLLDNLSIDNGRFNTCLEWPDYQVLQVTENRTYPCTKTTTKENEDFVKQSYALFIIISYLFANS